MFTLLPDLAYGDVLTEGVWDKVTTGVNAGVMRPVADVTLGASATSVNLSAIPSGFRSLCLRVVGRSSAAGATDNIRVQVNGDTAANYDYQVLSTSGGALSAAEAYGATAVVMVGFSTAASPANRFGSCELWVPDYVSAGEKSMLLVNNRFKGDLVADLTVQSIAAFWRSTAVVSSLQLTMTSGQFVAGSRFTLYALGGV